MSGLFYVEEVHAAHDGLQGRAVGCHPILRGGELNHPPIAPIHRVGHVHLRPCLIAELLDDLSAAADDGSRPGGGHQHPEGDGGGATSNARGGREGGHPRRAPLQEHGGMRGVALPGEAAVGCTGRQQQRPPGQAAIAAGRRGVHGLHAARLLAGDAGAELVGDGLHGPDDPRKRAHDLADVVVREAAGRYIVEHADGGARGGAQLVNHLPAPANEAAPLGAVKQQPHCKGLVVLVCRLAQLLHHTQQAGLAWAEGLVGGILSRDGDDPLGAACHRRLHLDPGPGASAHGLDATAALADDAA
mmetsp:Transcript_12097/g.33996  ORF Transcript_12097/g.33996 Transcript_12097/m.33996 type:complete len:302 (-) Transcript_12097:343-1248(-)